MARNSGWRQVCPEKVRGRQLLAVSGGSRVFLVRQSGPAAYKLQEEGRRKPLQVRLGDPHVCNCRTYRQERELCLHICWTLLRKLRLKPEDPLSYQMGLVPHDLEELIQGSHVWPLRVEKKRFQVMESVPSKLIGQKDLCPICLEELLESKRPVTFCRHGCGQSVHIACMKVVALHQTAHDLQDGRDDGMLNCPLCRGDFCTWRDLREEIRNALYYNRRLPLLPPLVGPRPVHKDVTCTSCNCTPVQGLLYRCFTCPFVLMCDECVTDRKGVGVAALHNDHGLAVKQNPSDRWRPLPRWESPQKRALLRDTPSPSCKVSEELISELRALRVCKGHALLNRGQQCCLCLTRYQVRQEVVTLPCGHQFHAACVTRWLLNSSDSCPLDGSPVSPTLRHRALQRGCDLKRMEFGKYKKQKKGLLESPLQNQALDTSLRVKGLSLIDRRNFKRQQQLQQLDKSLTSLVVSPRHYSANIGFSDFDLKNTSQSSWGAMRF
ncbi:E3 ubiquitin-protein ligase Zswim2-like [Cryptotermes secundus]|uniref:E3 ubiquitin-protein ligase Zswim2-like n=1 Tax=Cryptotermes secundus TaxID=105785 RepID=UPI001454C463|nr:E3 ubiquitin-protein ligase Zswim2-like [Cryptotermes secundus]